MAYVAVAGDTRTFFSGLAAMDLADEIAVTIHTIGLDYIRVEASDADGVWVVASSKGQAVIPAVDAFDDVFLGKGVGRVAAVAGCHILVAGMVPALELGAHDVTVQTGFRVVGKIGQPLGVVKGECAQADKHTDENNNGNAPQ